jgi:hypothetical protein
MVIHLSAFTKIQLLLYRSLLRAKYLPLSCPSRDVFAWSKWGLCFWSILMCWLYLLPEIMFETIQWVTYFHARYAFVRSCAWTRE